MGYRDEEAREEAVKDEWRLMREEERRAALGKYILVDGEPYPCDDLIRWARWLEKSDRDRIVAQTTEGDIMVSTVFLGIDHNFGHAGPPLLYETMIFGGKHDGYQERYATREEAERGHANACAMLRGEK